jgi:hypothetical protein
VYILLARDRGVVRVPKQGDGRQGGTLEDLEQRRTVGEVAVRLEDYRHAAAVRVLAERT